MPRVDTIRKWLISLTLMLAALLAVTSYVDQRAEVEYEKLFQRAFVTFALARTVNGVISVVQGTEIALQPAGVGVTLTPGEILDPVNDLVERFSWIMFGATISLGVQNVLLDIGAWWLIQVLVCALAVWIFVRLWYPGQDDQPLNPVLKRVFFLVLFIRFAVPGMLIANDLLYQQFLEPRYQQSTQVITAAGEDLEQLGTQVDIQEDGSDDAGLMQSIARKWSNAANSLDLPGKLERIQTRAGELTEHLVQLSVIFILQTGLLPVVFLWLFLQLVKRLIKPISKNNPLKI